MAHGFVTELLAEKPQVLVITHSRETALDLAGWSTAVQLEVITPPELPHGSEKLLNAYRVVWLATQATELPTSEFLDLLRELNHRLVIVAPMATGTQDTHPLMGSWAKEVRETSAHIQDLASQLPQASWLIGLDVFSADHSTAVLTTTTSLLAKNTWLDPQVDFYPQTWPAFLQNLPGLATQPRQFQKIIRGRKLHTSTLIKLLKLHYQRFLARETEIETVATTTTSSTLDWPSSTTLKVESGEDLAHVILPTLKQVAPLPAATSVSAQPKSQPLAAPPVKSPLAIPPRILIRQPQTHLAQGLAAKVNASPPKTTAQKPEHQAPSEKNLDEKLAALFQDYRSEQKIEQVKEVAQATTKTKKKSIRKKKFFWAGLLLIILAGVMGAGVLILSATSHQLKQTLLDNFAQPQTATQLPPSSRLAFWYQLARVHQQALAFLPGTQIVESGQLVQATDALLKFQTSAEALDHSSLNLVLAMTGRFPVDTRTLLTRIESQSQEAFTHLAEAQLYFKNIGQYQVEADKKQFLALEARLNELKRGFGPLQQLQPFLPTLLGLETKKTYALLLQNHQELRPTGGIIQAVAFVTLDKGMIVDTQVVSASSIMPATTSPLVPPDMAQLLGVSELHLADSGWSPDSPSSADQTISFLEQATTKNIDGVLFINTLDLASWLEAVGPLDLPEYHETVTAQNVLERLEAHSERQLVGNLQTDYATTLLTKLVQKTMLISQEKVAFLLETLYLQFESKQLALVVKDEAVRDVLRELGWSGNLIEPGCPPVLQQERCLVDVLAQAESNIGSNKANIYLDRQVSHQVQLMAEGIHHTHQIMYTNRSTSNAWPRGPYKAYIRLYVSPTARLEGITINGQNLAAEQKIQAFENNRQVFGAVIEVPVQQTVTLSYQYLQPSQQLSPFSYALFTQFQPGITVPPYEVKVNTGDFSASLVAPQATIDGSNVTFRSPTSLQSLVGIKFE